MTDYVYKTDPFDHQHESFMKTRDEKAWALLWEMGLGKTKTIIDTAAWNYAKERINFLLILAPNGVHTNWIKDELPAHMPDWTNYIAAEWGSQMKKDQTEQYEAVFTNYKSHPRLRVLAMNIEAMQTQERYYREKAGKLVRAILNAFNVLLVVDESSYIKTPGRNRTRRCITLSKHAEMQRILNGTPITNGPLDAYSQFKFLAGGGPPLLGPYSQNFQSFKNRYAEYEEHMRKDGRRYPELVAYRNLDELSTYMNETSTRLTKKECLDLPPKLYQKIPVEMHKEQARLYKMVLDEGMLELKSGDTVSVDNVLTLWLRLQQIVGGFVPNEDPESMAGAQCILDDPTDLPRVAKVMDYISQVQSGKVIICARFLAECAMWKKIYGDAAVTYVGKANYKDPEQREINKVRFQGTKVNNFEDHDPSVRILIMNKAGYRGLTLTHAQWVIYYSNSFSLDDRLQSEDRPHRIGQDNAVTYGDCIAEGTIDEKLVDAYREKKRLADTITKDDPSTWV